MKTTSTSKPKPQDLSIPIASAYIYMLAIVIPLITMLVWAYALIWGIGDFLIGLNHFLQLSSVIPAIVIGVPLHEFIHGLTWVLFSKQTFNEIKFGFQWKSLAPYAHLKVPVKARAYRAGAVMPALLLGLLPYLIGLAMGRGWFAAFGLFYVLAAGGDLVVLWLLRKVDPGALVEDHPSRAGCYVYA